MRTALREGKLAEFERLLKANPKSVSGTGQDGWTPLMYAALYGNVESCKLLLGEGAAVNARNTAGGTALMYAVDDVAKVKLLLERGADPNLRSGEGRTALMIAVANSGSFRL
jgi:ankyrin repeat protein